MHLLFVAAVSFVSVLVVELPDKTLVATLVLTSRYRRAPVLVGVAAAFAVQCVLAVTAGGLLALLPGRVVGLTVAALFAVGAVVLLRQGFAAAPEEAPSATDVTTSTRRIVAISFGVLFAAEWGDASQLATAALAARYRAPVTVGVAAFVALMAVAALASVLSAVILQRIDVRWIHRVAGVLFAVLSLVAVVDLVSG